MRALFYGYLPPLWSSLFLPSPFSLLYFCIPFSSWVFGLSFSFSISLSWLSFLIILVLWQKLSTLVNLWDQPWPIARFLASFLVFSFSVGFCLASHDHGSVFLSLSVFWHKLKMVILSCVWRWSLILGYVVFCFLLHTVH